MKKISLAALLVLLLLAMTGLTSGCGGGEANASTSDNDKSGGKSGSAEAGEPGQDDEEDEEQAVPVEVADLATGEIESILRFSTNLEAESQVQVFSQAKRQVTDLLVEEGDTVRRGDVLLRLQDDEQRSALAKVQGQLSKAEREYKRQQRLFEQQLIAEQTYNEATYEVEQFRIALEDAQRELSYTDVRAPISGRVTNRLVNLGDQVQIGQHLFDIVDFDSIVARLFVPEKHLTILERGLPARVSAAAAGRDDYLGSVIRISPIVDPKSGTVKVTVGIGGQPGLRPGMYVDVDLVTATHSDALLVPKRAVLYDNDQMFAYKLVDDRRVERVYIEPVLADKEHIEPGEGFAEGDRIVIAGQAGLKDGALVSLPGDEAEEEAARIEETEATAETEEEEPADDSEAAVG